MVTAPGVRYRVVYQSRSIAVGDWRCVPAQVGPGPEEATGESAIVFVRQGVFRRHLTHTCTLADPNAVMFFNPNEGYRVSHPSLSGDRCVVITVSEPMLHPLMDAVGLGEPSPSDGPFQRSHGYVSTTVLLRLRRTLKTMERQGALEIEESVFSAVAAALEIQHNRPRPRESTSGASRRSVVEKVREIAATRFNERLSLQTLSEEAGYSPYHLLRLFRDETGIAIHRYVNRLRLLHALDRLDLADNLSHLAFELGFSSHSHFTNAFTREFGIPPSQVRGALGPPRGKRLSAQLRVRGHLRAHLTAARLGRSP